jgi:hypothetical protein
MPQSRSFIVGRTTSGKQIHCATKPERTEAVLASKLVNFSPDECFDAYCAYEFLASRSLARLKASPIERKLFRWHSESILLMFFNDELLLSTKTKFKLLSPQEITQYGSSLVNVEFRGL